MVKMAVQQGWSLWEWGVVSHIKLRCLHIPVVREGQVVFKRWTGGKILKGILIFLRSSLNSTRTANYCFLSKNMIQDTRSKRLRDVQLSQRSQYNPLGQMLLQPRSWALRSVWPMVPSALWLQSLRMPLEGEDRKISTALTRGSKRPWCSCTPCRLTRVAE